MFLAYTAHRCGLRLWHCPGTLTRRNIWDVETIKGFTCFEGVYVRKKGKKHLLLGLATR